ncbi:exodeoxyribonuclease VII small subunit [Geosporobacter ferrireducens]|uniref:Exodeoxyribonuclease 7 small subunit n=1 Tax=Geosporobacter ferrireducens TaxID=1424294 RepID=A0A1D8GB71_9FIRM|nr:exodeoxyribonuclease VII small subunit [Geosporobacter ferrireducens]AOT68150.1 exodeoxyribonuclease VII small subunit [Geosporobacter ferrireducens]MTI54199.1 exodeoxyribonuclease VII small subunit [Geosporobacter ferrireducens]
MDTNFKNSESDNFETSILRLEEIVSALESGKLPLAETLKLYEEAILIYKNCNQLLDDAEQKISMLAKADDGDFILKELAE